MIEVDYYEINSISKTLTDIDYEKPNVGVTFWEDATRYTASRNHDEPFVSEIAYMMVTLHRTGA